MEILLPEQNYSLDELNSTIYTAVKGYIENIRLLKLANLDALYLEKGTKVTVPFPTYNQCKFDWEWNKDYYKPRKTIKTGDDLTLGLDIRLHKSLEGLGIGFSVQVSISATRVRKSKKTNKLGYIFKSISYITSDDNFVARLQHQQSLYVSNFVSNIYWKYDDEIKTYSYEDTQLQQSKTVIENNISHTQLFYFPKGQVKARNISEDTKQNFPKNTPITLVPIDFIPSAFQSFVKQMKRN